jgi:putative DNA primase/helicase
MSTTKLFESVFPLDSRTKKPFTEHGFKDATNNPEVIEKWKRNFPNCGWGIPTGEEFFVIDLDKKYGGLERWDKLIKEYGEVKAFTVRTQHDGQHLYFLSNGIDIRNSKGKVAKGIDIRGNGGYVVIPPTPGYEIINDTELASPPTWLLNLILKKDIHQSFKEPEIIPKGDRNETLFKLASSLRAKGLSEEAISSALQIENKNRCKPPLDDSDVETISNSASKYEQGTLKEDDFHFTDLGNAKRFAEIHKGKAKYCTEEKTWYIWNGKKWEADRLGKIYRLAEEVILLIYKEATTAIDSEDRKLLAKHACKTESDASIRHMVSLAESYLAVLPESFDTDKELVNVNNGIINLRTKELIPHSPDYLMRRIIPFAYYPDADCPKWKAFLELILNKDTETIRWIQKALGLSISGRTDRILPFLFGAGCNGKSVYSETILKIFGGYGQKTNIDAMSEGDFREGGDKANSVVARLKGVRLAIANETRLNVKLNTSLIKDLTGNDTISNRDMWEKNKTFEPTHTMWIYGNHKPIIEDTTDSIWDRMCEIEFKVKIPDEMKKNSDDVISEFIAEAPGIIKWIVDGYSLYLAETLKKTKAIEKSTNEFRAEEDIFRQFIEEECETGEGLEIPKDNLISQFNAYCNKYGDRKSTLTKSKITRRLKEMGIIESGHARSLYSGIQLQNNGVLIAVPDSVRRILDETYITISGM